MSSESRGNGCAGELLLARNHRQADWLVGGVLRISADHRPGSTVFSLGPIETPAGALRHQNGPPRAKEPKIHPLRSLTPKPSMPGSGERAQVRPLKIITSLSSPPRSAMLLPAPCTLSWHRIALSNAQRQRQARPTARSAELNAGIKTSEMSEVGEQGRGGFGSTLHTVFGTKVPSCKTSQRPGNVISRRVRTAHWAASRMTLDGHHCALRPQRQCCSPPA